MKTIVTANNMKNNSNIYDIDGELIRSTDDTHEMTAEEAQTRIEMYKNKLEELEEKDPKRAVYTTYIRNLTNYVLGLYAKMTPTQMSAELDRIKAQENTAEQVKNAIDELKKEIEDEESSTDTTEPAESVESTERPETVMDTYIDFEEV